jgi:hypothetical protein
VEGPAGVGGAAQVGDAVLPMGRLGEAGGQRALPHRLDHGDEGVAGEPLDDRWPVCVGVHRAGLYRDVPVAGFGKQRLQLPADQRVAAVGRL